MSTPDEFARRLDLIASNIPQAVNAVKIALAAAIDQAVVVQTPVDTGHARLNWQVGLGTPIRSEKPGEDPGGAAARAIALGVARIRAARPSQSIYISNNVPYINRLNEGWSAQAPADFVRRSLLLAVNQVLGNRRVINILRRGR